MYESKIVVPALGTNPATGGRGRQLATPAWRGSTGLVPDKWPEVAGVSPANAMASPSMCSRGPRGEPHDAFLANDPWAAHATSDGTTLGANGYDEHAVGSIQVLQAATMSMPTNKTAPFAAAGAEPAHQTILEHASTASPGEHGMQGNRGRWSLCEPSPLSGHQNSWGAELLDFANGPSIELCVLRDQVNAGHDKLPRLPCHQGDIVTGISRLRDGTLEAVWCVVYKDGVRSEGIVPRSECRPCEPYEFTVAVPDAATHVSAALGLEGSVKPHGLEVHAVRAGGSVETWNDECTRGMMRDIVRVGDIIVSTNGSRDLADMLMSLGGAGCVQLCVRRTSLSGLQRPLTYP
mmetsp:Transcript_103043/g.204544  ORF Transcript_103043/g.204544 Transcript_103043/m.204544 type:complete len:349 (+) Transcript_103043:94-1140(+)